ncbi:hypothetical protein [Martelella sp. HB161492]|uniref:hypothetical protein n=1 Tax=Martelella sp. HB161492 TaxID=2720726 RepID=UPI00159257F0|nr:hypothetical protein [Martelella sp. HB161492]
MTALGFAISHCLQPPRNAGGPLIGFRLTKTVTEAWPADDNARLVGAAVYAYAAESFALDNSSTAAWPDDETGRVVGVVIPKF